MSKRVLGFGAGLAVLITAIVGILALLDVITWDHIAESLPRLLGVVLVATVAVLLVVGVGRFAGRG